MHVTLVLPGLRHEAPDSLAALRSVALPGLAWLLGRARLRSGVAATSTEAFASAFGLGGIGPAVLRRAGETALPLPQADELWLCADPVGLHFARDQMILTEPAALGLTQAETDALGEVLQDALKDVGDFVLATPQRGYLRLHAPSHASFSDLLDVAGRPVALFLPEGRDALRWGRIVNAVQIALHEHPVNRAREAAGQRLCNSLWFWGEGTLGSAHARGPSRVFSDNAVGTGLARLAGLDATPLASFASRAAEGNALLMSDTLDAPARFRDTARWLDALLELESQAFSPLAEQMRRGKIGQVRIAAPGERDGLNIDIAAQRWAFWRGPKAPEILLAPLSP